MGQFKFLPSLQIGLMADDRQKRDEILELSKQHEEFDIFTEEMLSNGVLQFNLNDLSKYITPRLIIKKRAVGKGSLVYNVDFRRCTI